jgi:hypothetical protein
MKKPKGKAAQLWRGNHSRALSEELSYILIMQRRRKSRRPIVERYTPIRVSQFARWGCLGPYLCDFQTPLAFPFMQKLRASRARVWFQHKTSGLLHKFTIEPEQYEC